MNKNIIIKEKISLIYKYLEYSALKNNKNAQKISIDVF
jgi:hypothetical protein